jgi:hypothetical protein
MLLNGLLLPSIGRVQVCPISISVEADVFLFPLATQSLGPTSLESLIQTSQPQTYGGRNCAEHLVCTLAALTSNRNGVNTPVTMFSRLSEQSTIKML